MALPRHRRLQAGLIAAAGVPLIEGLGATYRWHEYGAHHVETVVREGRQPIYALWHGRILAGTLYLRDRGITVIISENFDGEWIARIVRRFGFATARGSTSRGGARALVQMRRHMRADLPAAFTLDGPRGPARVAQPGAVWLASATGNPILPIHFESASRWTVNSWDRHQIPKPGTDIAVAIGAPLNVPPDADDAAIEQGRIELQDALTALEQRALAMLRQDAAH